jgi:predicted transcriptional regulator
MLTKVYTSQKRNNLEIVAEILKIARNGAKKTRIVYGANMNFRMLEEYLEKLEKAGLITNSEGKYGLIKTTEKGVEYLQRFIGLQEFRID